MCVLVWFAIALVQANNIARLDENLKFTSWTLLHLPFGYLTGSFPNTSISLSSNNQVAPSSNILPPSTEPTIIYMGEDYDQSSLYRPGNIRRATNRDRYEQLAVLKHSRVPLRICKAHERAGRSVMPMAAAATTNLS